MSPYEEWEENNEEYLAAALAWLRLLLQRFAAGGPDEPQAGGSPEGRLPSGEAIARAAEAMAAAEAALPSPALTLLARQFGLSRFEQEVLLLCAAMELDTRISGLCARAQDDPGRPYPTFALALALFEDRSWDALLPERPLRYYRLIECHQQAALPLTASALQADERVVHFIKGHNRLDNRLIPFTVPFDTAYAEPEALSPSQFAAAERIRRHLQGEGDSGRPTLVQLVGPDTVSKQAVTHHAVLSAGIRITRIPVALLPSQAADLDMLARLWQRESLLVPIALYLDAGLEGEPGTAGEAQNATLERFLLLYGGPALIDTREVRPDLDRTTLILDIERPTPAEQKAAWAAALGERGKESPALLAGQFNLNLQAIRQIAGPVLDGADDGDTGLHDGLWSACLERTRPGIEQLARRIDPKARWEDLVLPEEQQSLLRRIADQVRRRSTVYDEWGFRHRMNRGLGISALFAGESGTGKTMAAEVIANDLGLDLYRIDLSAVVNKYIGETEKNLRRLFDAAEDGGAILFFDEADALFGKRSEVKDSHDRYANIEINYLLQRIEAYRGLAILATNMKSSLDPAFLRRLRFIVAFPFPGQPERRRIWERVFPPETETEGLEIDRLARLNLTGGSIHNTALNAAFLAAEAGTPVTMPLVLQAARAEFRKMERPINEADFRWTEAAKKGGDA
ncbi:MAG: ATP-binding protein [Methanomicrobiaceae archaeon]|uniref:Atpase, aaa family n=1 Tax=hydrocarbon metagenome TaxID=938273 RepID=A0A0W8FIK7_9ZZZZ|nr:ATP-binding protein [Methanomicrobiaceae archaeon]MDD5418723.1 ATP-binding protein [Methanomicrobiaceae archaeon]